MTPRAPGTAVASSSCRRMQFFGGRLISYLLPEHISTRCPLGASSWSTRSPPVRLNWRAGSLLACLPVFAGLVDLVAEEHAIATGNHHTRRASDTVLPFLTGTQTLNATVRPVPHSPSTASTTYHP